MRKCSLIIIALIFLQVNFGFAQVDKKANAILAGVSVKYKSYKSINKMFKVGSFDEVNTNEKKNLIALMI